MRNYLNLIAIKIDTKLRISSKLHLASLLFLTAIISWLVFFVPSNMDEFLPYHRLACDQYINAYLHSFRESCSGYPAELWGYNFNRSYIYVGYISNIAYFPFFKSFSSHFSHYFYGILALFLFSWMIVSAFDLKKEALLIPSLYFPILFQFIHDTGPIRISFIAVASICIFMKRLFYKDSGMVNEYFMGLIAALLIVCSIEDKPFFLYVLPSSLLVGLSIYNFRYCKFDFRLKNKLALHRFLVLFAFSLIILFGIFLILMVTKIPDNNNSTYLYYLIGLPINRLSYYDELKIMVSYIINPIYFTSRIFEVTDVKYNFLNLLTTIAFLPFLLIAINFVRKNLNLSNIILVFAFIINFLIFIIARNAWSGHHFIYLHIPLIIIIMKAFSQYEKCKKFIFYIFFLNISLAIFSMNIISIRSDSNFEIDKIINHINLQYHSYIINYSSWGGYYKHSLYGNSNQLVTYIEPLNIGYADSLKKLLQIRSLNKVGIINVCNNCDLEQMRSFFLDMNINEIDIHDGSWRAWKIIPK